MATTPVLDSAAFSLGAGTVTRESSGSRTLFAFAAPATRHFDGGFELSVYAVLYDGDGRFIARRSSEWGRPVFLANRATWAHEFTADQLAGGRRLVYEIEHRFDLRRRIAAGELPELPGEADGSDYWRWVTVDPRTLDERAVRFDLGLWARTSGVDVTIVQHPKVETDSMRTELEVELLDANRDVCVARPMSVSLNRGGPGFTDVSLSVDRKTLRTLRFFEVRGRTEVSAMARLVLEPLP
ncbi:MAG: hypothetical protein HS111_35550 [Kofleriaceae bacterium]|nr:hypothetical protein [Kofleriaceae bacterium]MCL4224473.1 hypothetical protein [Myxococcales bacterium]